jgi:hypothetical protein
VEGESAISFFQMGSISIRRLRSRIWSVNAHEPRSADFRTVRKVAERFGKIRKGAEDFGTFPNPSEHKKSQTMTVRSGLPGGSRGRAAHRAQDYQLV